MYFSAAISGLLLLVIVATLIVRRQNRSNACFVWTKAVNIFLLLYVPFGTVVGIYGLLKLDRVKTSTGA